MPSGSGSSSFSLPMIKLLRIMLDRFHTSLISSKAGFNSQIRNYGHIAQLAERTAVNRVVDGSIPSMSALLFTEIRNEKRLFLSFKLETMNVNIFYQKDINGIKIWYIPFLRLIKNMP